MARWIGSRGGLVLAVGAVAGAGSVACGNSASHATSVGTADGGGISEGGSLPDEGTDADEGESSAANGVLNGTPGTFNVFDQIPQFGIYASMSPADYTPPPGLDMWSNGTVWVTKLTPEQQSKIGADLAARITYFAQCDDYDRLGGLFFIVEPVGQAPTPTDPRTEIVRFITPFSDWTEGLFGKEVYPNASLGPFAETLADRTHDIWIGIAGGSNPYSTPAPGDPCVQLDAGPPGAGPDAFEVGFKYSVDFVSTKPLALAPSVVLTAISGVSETSTPITGTFMNTGSSPLAGHMTVIVSGHGSECADGWEYESTQDTLTVNGAEVGSFSTEIDCAPFARYSPDGNPCLFLDNVSLDNTTPMSCWCDTYSPPTTCPPPAGLTNQRNWCPGAFVPSHTFPATLQPGANSVSLGITPGSPPGDAAAPCGSYFATSVNFTSP